MKGKKSAKGFGGNGSRGGLVRGVVAAILLAGCAADEPAQPETAQGPVNWGESVNGLQIGIAAEVTQSPPGQPQVADAQFRGARVILRNTGETPFQIVDPKPLTAASQAQATLWSIYTEPDHTAQVEYPRPAPARIILLIPGQMTWFFVPLPMLPSGQGAHHVTAEYENADSVITIASANGTPPTQSAQVWTGHVKSDELFLNDAP
jgi:hypothetical protein